MTRFSPILLLAVTFVWIGCGSGPSGETPIDVDTDTLSVDPTEPETETKVAEVNLVATSGSELSGTVTFTEEDGMVTMVAEISGLTKGVHAIHIHEFGDCSTEDGSSAGGHWNPTGDPHGKWGDADGYHRGDIGNIEADENGVGTITMTTDEWCVDCGDADKDVVGHSIIIHDLPDDFVTQPTGNAGIRLACGVIELHN